MTFKRSILFSHLKQMCFWNGSIYRFSVMVQTSITEELHFILWMQIRTRLWGAEISFWVFKIFSLKNCDTGNVFCIFEQNIWNRIEIGGVSEVVGLERGTWWNRRGHHDVVDRSRFRSSPRRSSRRQDLQSAQSSMSTFLSQLIISCSFLRLNTCLISVNISTPQIRL